MSNISQERATGAVQALKQLVEGLQSGESLEAVRDCFKRLGCEVHGLAVTGKEAVNCKLAAVSFLR